MSLNVPLWITGTALGIGALLTWKAVPSRTSRFPSRLIGSWDFLSFEVHTKQSDGTHIEYPLGRDVSGEVTYTADGHMSAQMMAIGCPRFDNFYFFATDEELTNAGKHFLGYAGTYSISEEDGEVIVHHHVKCSNFPNLVNGTVHRAVDLDGDILTLRPRDGTTSWKDNEGQPIVTWRRSKAATIL
ncbi:hypothetical protein ASPWEDRAFT_747920 [Aspergillus wentii DTO 134E9]|uniref:Lipocalin-like domain-containing protein n=1 Tax=Aspergillus wentii DTO 134E9 TaxID=1073089 RepID=A0A1L9R5M1_ASPWE|nr:uncharacterized protein ASPWEDRAFT_747920 [Aspergillus wentii DTO 134E9]OJJ30178.1 hypothetical protein ASPWEDRAFT_747920 [Aspergillus wentii DTO 134E9]